MPYINNCIVGYNEDINWGLHGPAFRYDISYQLYEAISQQIRRTNSKADLVLETMEQRLKLLQTD